MLTMTPIERFRNDNEFRAITEQMVNMLEQGLCDYATLQQASIAASIRHGQLHGMAPCPAAIAFMNSQSSLIEVTNDKENDN